MSFTAETRERTRPTLPLAAMVDVLFLLLIFFMTASVFRQQELQIDVQLPTAETAQPGRSGADELVITFQEDGSIYLEGTELTIPELRDRLGRLAEVAADDAIVIRGDQKGQFGLAVQLLDVAQEAGFTDARIATVKSADQLE